VAYDDADTQKLLMEGMSAEEKAGFLLFQKNQNLQRLGQTISAEEKAALTKYQDTKREKARVENNARRSSQTKEMLEGKRLHYGRAVRMVPVSELENVQVKEWHPGRSAEVEQGYKEGALMPPIEVEASNEPGGPRSVNDGNHRLAVARRLGIKEIPVRFGEGADHKPVDAIGRVLDAGPRGGSFYVSPSGKKVYVKKG